MPTIKDLCLAAEELTPGWPARIVAAWEHEHRRRPFPEGAEMRHAADRAQIYRAGVYVGSLTPNGNGRKRWTLRYAGGGAITFASIERLLLNRVWWERIMRIVRDDWSKDRAQQAT